MNIVISYGYYILNFSICQQFLLTIIDIFNNIIIKAFNIKEGDTVNRIKELRLEKKLNQKELAEIIGIAQPTLSGWETGRTQIDYDNLIKLAKYFEVSLDTLLGADTAPTQIGEKIPKDLKKLLNEEEITLNGRMVSPEDKEKMLRIIEALYYDAKEENKRKS